MKAVNWIILLLLVLSGCKAGKNYQGTELNVPDAFYFENENEDPGYLKVRTDSLNRDGMKDLEWFGLFNDSFLDSLIRQALEYNQDLNVAAEAILQAQDGLVIQRSAMLPYVGKEFGASRGNFQGVVQPDVQNLYYTAAFVNWDIDFWGKYRRLNEAARARIVQTTEGFRATRLSLISTVAAEYFLLLDYRMRLEISERNLALRDSTLTIIEKRFEKGIVAEIEVNQAQIKRAVAAEAVPVWKRLIAQTENRISVLTGTNPRRIPVNTRLIDQDTAINIPAGLPSELLLRRPDIAAAEQSLIAQNALIGVAKANRLPNISLTGLFGLATNDLSNISEVPFAWNIGGTLTGPFLISGDLKGRLKLKKVKPGKLNWCINVWCSMHFVQ